MAYISDNWKGETLLSSILKKKKKTNNLILFANILDNHSILILSPVVYISTTGKYYSVSFT